MKLDLYTLEQIYKTFGLTILDVEKLPQDKLRDMVRYVEPEDCTCSLTLRTDGYQLLIDGMTSIKQP